MTRIGLFGTEALELPGAGVRAFAPAGAEPLGLWTRERLRELAADLDLVVVTGDVGHLRDELHADALGVDAFHARLQRPSDFFVRGLGPFEAHCPVVWHAVGVPFDLDPYEAREVREALAPRPLVSVRDAASVRRLRAAGVEQPLLVGGDVGALLELASAQRPPLPASEPPAHDGAALELTRRRLLEERRLHADLVTEVLADRDQARFELGEAKTYIASLEAEVERLRARPEPGPQPPRRLRDRLRR